MKSWFKAVVTNWAAIPFAACVLVPGNTAFAKEPVTTPSAATPAASDADPALWVVKDADTTIYLLGTVHFLKPGLGWFDEAVKDAFDRSGELMLEMVIPEDPAELRATTERLAIDPNGRTMASRMSQADHEAYAAMLAGLGLNPEMFEKFEPWYMGLNLSVLPLLSKGYDPNLGPETILTRHAKESGKVVAGFETLEEQFGFFDTLSDASQLAFLNSVVRDKDKLVPLLDTLVVEWTQGDSVALAATMNESLTETPELAKVLLWDRNARWADAIKARMNQPGTVFVAVGAGHLAGDRSVQDYLKIRGLTAARVRY